MDNAQKYIPRTKKEKIFRWLNIAFDIAIMLAGIALAIYYHSIGDPNNRFFYQPWNVGLWCPSFYLRTHLTRKAHKFCIFDF